MNLALIIIIVVAIILAIVGGLNSALSWLLWVAIIFCGRFIAYVESN